MPLNTVVLPAPLGPMMAKISWGKSCSATPSTATRPPKRMLRSCTSSKCSLCMLWSFLCNRGQGADPTPGATDGAGMRSGLGVWEMAPVFWADVDLIALHGQQTLRAPDHHEDHDQTKNQHAVFGKLACQLWQYRQQHGRDDHAQL